MELNETLGDLRIATCPTRWECFEEKFLSKSAVMGGETVGTGQMSNSHNSIIFSSIILKFGLNTFFNMPNNHK